MPPLGQTQFTPEQMIAAMWRVYEETGLAGAKTYSRERRSTEPTGVTIAEGFGSWRKAQEAAGLPVGAPAPDGFGERKFSEDDLLYAVRQVVREVGSHRGLTVRDYDRLRQPGMPCSAGIRRRLRRRYGGWSQIVAYVGGTPGNPSKRPVGS